MQAPILDSEAHPARHWHPLEDGRLQCDVCPRDCKIAEGQRGMCFVRGNHHGQMVLTTWGRSSGFAVDPIEKKPLAHFLPGTPILSFGTAGCNLTCKFCQNWEMSKSREVDTLADTATPSGIVAAARRTGSRSVAFTYNDPVIFLEYAIDVAAACREAGIKSVAVTAGYIHAEPRRELFQAMDATNVDLKAFTEGFYQKLCTAKLAPVLETLEYIHHETPCWLEITTLLIPGQNDGEGEIHALSAWIREHLSPDVPLHFSAFHPDFRMQDTPPTPPETLRRARQIAREEGLRHVYTGNVHDLEGDQTLCHACGTVLIERDWYQLRGWHLTAEGSCPQCGTACAGVFEAQPGHWGRKRLPVRIGG